MLSAVFSPRSDIKAEHLSGPVGIMRIYSLLFESPDGWRLALWFSVVLNVNLAIMNLLPLPVLDGGHLMYYVVEILIGRPVSEMAMEIGQRIGLAILMVLMVFALYNDFSRLFSG